MQSRGFFPEAMLAKVTAPAKIIPECGACGLYRGCTNPKMPVSGEGRRKILVVAEAPGEEEDKQGTQLVGADGQLVRHTFRKYGIELDRDCWKTNALICRPPDDAKPDNLQIGYCRPNVMAAIEEYNPETIILLGGVAINSVIGALWREDVGGSARWAGYQVPAHRPNAWLCPTYHPSYVRREKRNPLVALWWERHLEAAFARSGRPHAIPPDYRHQVEVVLDTDKAARILTQMVAKGGPVAFDYETNMLKPDWPDSRIICAAACWRGRRTIAYPWHGAAIEASRQLLWSAEPKIAANMKFEHRWTHRAFGRGVRNWLFDTMLGAHYIDNRAEIASLKFQSFALLGQPAYDNHIAPYLKNYGDSRMNRAVKEVPIEELLLYNGMDALLEYHVAVTQMTAMGMEMP